MSKTCSLCKQEVMSWHSYQSGASGTVHMACALGRSPAPHPTAHYHHSNTQFNKGDLRRERHTVVSDEGIVFDVAEDAK